MSKDKKSSGGEKPQPPKELSSALKGLRFMARKEKSDEQQKVVKEAKVNATQQQLPETTEPVALSVFAAHCSRPNAVVFRKALSFATDSDSLAEVRLRERNHRKKPRGEEMGRFKSKDQRTYDQENEDDDSSVSTVDDLTVAQHFNRNKKRGRT